MPALVKKKLKALIHFPTIAVINMLLFICCGNSIEFGDGYAPNYSIDDNRIKFFQDYHRQVLVTRITDQPGPVSQPEIIWKYHAGGMIYSTPALLIIFCFLAPQTVHFIASTYEAGLWSGENDPRVFL